MTFHRNKHKDRKTRKGWYRVGPKRNLVKFITVYVSKTMSGKEFNPPATYLILRNRGDDSTPPTGSIELTTPDSDDTFLLQCGERERLGPSKYTKICYKRSDDGHGKVRLDIHAF